MARSQFAILALSFFGLSFSQLSLAEGGTPFPTANSDRPFTLPQGMTEVAGKMKLAVHGDGAGNIASNDMLSLDWVQIGVGVTDDFQLGLGWSGFQIPKINPSQSIILNAGYFLFAGKYAAGMVNLDVPVYFKSSVFRNVTLAVPTAFGVTEHSGIMAFHDGLLDVGFANQKYSATVNLPIRYGYQPTPNLWVGIESAIAKFEFNTGNDHSFFWKSAPLKVKGLYAITNAFDVIGQTGFDDAFNAKDTFSVVLGLQYRVGNLDG